jgi:hypothetical protein
MGSHSYSPNHTLGGHEVTGGDHAHSKGTGFHTEVGDVTLELAPKFH